MSLKIIPSAEAMIDLGGRYAADAKLGDVFALVGDLGTGKTHWSKGFVRGLCPKIPVTSPTFSIVNEYSDSAHTIFHFDFYRLKSEQELIDLGWDEYLDQAAIVICEWADLFPHLMPENTKWLEIRHQPDGSRTVVERGAAAISARDIVADLPREPRLKEI